VRSKWTLALLLFAASIGFQASFITLDTFPSDEGVVLVAANDVASGKHLYTDCYVPVTPSVYLALGAAFKLFGASFEISRWLICLIYAASVALVFGIAVSIVPVRVAVTCGLIAILLQVWMWPHAHFFTYTPLSIFFCLLALLLAWRIEIGPHPAVLAWLFGAALGLAIWVKPNLGVATGAGVLAFWLSGWIREQAGLPVARTRSLGSILSDGLATLAGIASVSVPQILYLVATHSLIPMVDSLVALTRIYADVPSGIFPDLWPAGAQLDGVRQNPLRVLPGMMWSSLWAAPDFRYLMKYSGLIDALVRAAYLAPLVVYGAAALHLGARLVHRSWQREDEACLLAWLVGFFLLLTIIPHPAFHYVVPTLFPAIVVVGLLAHRALTAAGRHARWLARAVTGSLALAYVVSSGTILWIYQDTLRAPVKSEVGTIWMPFDSAKIWNLILDYTRRTVPSEERIFVVPYAPIFYFLSGREHPIRFVDLRPGSPGVEAEDEMIESLERQQVGFVLYMRGLQFPGIERFEQAYPRLDHYIERRYEISREFRSLFGTFAELRRRRSPPGSGPPASGE